MLEGGAEAPKADLAKMQAALKTKRCLEPKRGIRRCFSSTRRFSGTNIRKEIRGAADSNIAISTREMELYKELEELWKVQKAKFSSGIQEKTKNFLREVRSICDRFSRNVLRKKIACDEFWKQWNTFNENISKDITQRITAKCNAMRVHRKDFIASLGDGEHPTLEGTLTTEKLSIFWELLQEQQKENEVTKMHKSNIDALLIQINELRALDSDLKHQMNRISSQFEEIFGPMKKDTQEDPSPKRTPRKAPVMSPEEQQELEKLDTENVILKRELKSTLDEKRLLEKKLRELQDKSSEETDKIHKMIKQMRPKKKEAEAAKLEFTALSEETSTLKKEFEKLESEAIPLRAQLKQYESESLEKSEANIKSLTEGNKSLTDELAALTEHVLAKEEIVERLTSYAQNIGIGDKLQSIGLRKQLHDLKYRAFTEKHYSARAAPLMQNIENEQQQMSLLIYSTEEKFHSKMNKLREIQAELVKSHKELIDIQYQSQIDALHELRMDLNIDLAKKREDALVEISELRRNRENTAKVYKNLQEKYNAVVKGHRKALPDGLSLTEAETELELLMQQYAEDGAMIKKVSLKEAHDEIVSITNTGARIRAVKDKQTSWMNDMSTATNALRAKHALLRAETQIMTKKLTNPDLDVAGEFLKRKSKVDSEVERLRETAASSAELLREVCSRIGGTPEEGEPVETLLMKIQDILVQEH